MIELEKIKNIFIISGFFSFFLLQVSNLCLIFFTNLTGLISNTTYNNLGFITSLFLHLIFLILKYTSIIILIGCAIGIIAIFISELKKNADII